MQSIYTGPDKIFFYQNVLIFHEENIVKKMIFQLFLHTNLYRRKFDLAVNLFKWFCSGGQDGRHDIYGKNT